MGRNETLAAVTALKLKPRAPSERFCRLLVNRQEFAPIWQKRLKRWIMSMSNDIESTTEHNVGELNRLATIKGPSPMNTTLPRGRHLIEVQDAPFPNRLRELRLTARISQRTLGKLVGMSQSQLGAIERGLYKPSQKLLESLAVHLNTQPWHLFHNTSVEAFDQLIARYTQLTADQQRTVLSMIDTMLAQNAELASKAARSQGKPKLTVAKSKLSKA